MKVPRGLSPRGRGILRALGKDGEVLGSIPAWAGHPDGCRFCINGLRVYPRVGGASTRPSSGADSQSGLSPRGRGIPTIINVYIIIYRSIPAWAGHPCACGASSPSATVYPRVGGASLARVVQRRRVKGLSPRGRGILFDGIEGTLLPGSIPAWAGHPLRQNVREQPPVRYRRKTGKAIRADKCHESPHRRSTTRSSRWMA